MLICIIVSLTINQIIMFMSLSFERRIVKKGLKINKSIRDILDEVINKEKVDITAIEESDYNSYNHENKTIYLQKEYLESKHSYLHFFFSGLHELGHAMQSEEEFKSKQAVFLSTVFFYSVMIMFILFFIFGIQDKGILTFISMCILFIRTFKVSSAVYYEWSANKYFSKMCVKYFDFISTEEKKYTYRYKNIAMATYINQLILWWTFTVLWLIIF